MNARLRFRARVCTLLLTLLSGILLSGYPGWGLAQGITGEVPGCPRPGCDVTARLHLNPPRDIASVTATLFVAIARMEGGQPDLSVGGWYDGRAWKTAGAPVAAYTGRLTRRTATVRIPGGVCGLVKSAGGPPGTYALFAGWGRTGSSGNHDHYRKDEADLVAMMQAFEDQGDTESAGKIRALVEEYRAALGRLEQEDTGELSAFSDAQRHGTVWTIASFDCTQAASSTRTSGSRNRGTR